MPLKNSPFSLPLSPHSLAHPPPCLYSIPSSSAMLMNKTPSSMTSTVVWWCRRWAQMHLRCQLPLTFGHCTLPSSGWTTKAQAQVGARGGHSPLWTPSLSQCGHVSLQRSSKTRSGLEELLDQVCPGPHLERLLHVCRGNDYYMSITVLMVHQHHLTAMRQLSHPVMVSINASRWTLCLPPLPLCHLRVKMLE